jgi:regulator of sigma E protease
VSWLIAFLGFSALIVLHELGHFAVAKWVGMRVERFSLFFPPLIFRKQIGETEYAVGSVPLGGYVKISGMNPAEEIPPEHAHRAYFRQPVWKRIAVISAGPAVNIVLAFLILWVLAWSNGVRERDRLAVAVIERTAPAAGQLQKGDQVIAVDGVHDAELFAKQISSHRCAGRLVPGCRAATPVRLTVIRQGRTVTLAIRPVYAKFKRMRIGVSFDSVIRPLGPGAAAGESVKEMWRFTTATVSAIARIFDPQKRKEISGVVGSYEVTRQAVQVDLTLAVYILAVISLSLGVINLFPFLPLDGGHIFWALAEKVRGRPIPFSVLERAGVVGFVLVMLLFLIGFTNDIQRLTGEGFGVR